MFRGKGIYICPFTGIGGGTRVIGEHVARLAARGWDTEWWGLESPNNRPRYRQFQNTHELGANLRGISPKIVVATWWQTASWAAPNLLPGDKGFYLVQDLDGETYGGDPLGESYRLGLQPLTESEWVTEQLRTRWGLNPINIGIGIDFDVFKPLAIPRDYNRIMTTYRPGNNDLKGWGLAHQTFQEVRKLNPAASLVTFGCFGSPRVQGPHIHVNAPPDWKLRELYSQAGCYLMTSRHEGFGLPGAEAMACSCPVICTDAHGNMEFCREYANVGATATDLAALIVKNGELATEAAMNYVRFRYQWSDVIDRLGAALKRQS